MPSPCRPAPRGRRSPRRAARSRTSRPAATWPASRSAPRWPRATGAGCASGGCARTSARVRAAAELPRELARAAPATGVPCRRCPSSRGLFHRLAGTGSSEATLTTKALAATGRGHRDGGASRSRRPRVVHHHHGSPATAPAPLRSTHAPSNARAGDAPVAGPAQAPDLARRAVPRRTASAHAAHGGRIDTHRLATKPTAQAGAPGRGGDGAVERGQPPRPARRSRRRRARPPAGGSPGKSGTAPGQSGTAPGQSGTAPAARAAPHPARATPRRATAPTHPATPPTPPATAPTHPATPPTPPATAPTHPAHAADAPGNSAQRTRPERHPARAGQGRRQARLGRRQRPAARPQEGVDKP